MLKKYGKTSTKRISEKSSKILGSSLLGQRKVEGKRQGPGIPSVTDQRQTRFENAQSESHRPIPDVSSPKPKKSVTTPSSDAQLIVENVVPPEEHDVFSRAPKLERDFTFSGYDILTDENDSIFKIAVSVFTVLNPDAEQTGGADPTPVDPESKIYIQSCRQMKIVPVSHIVRSLGTASLKCPSYELGPRGAKAIAISLVNNACITEVDLMDNHIGDVGVKAIGDVCAVNSNIISLNLSWNNVSTYGIKSLCDVFKNNKTLNSLDISGNRLSDDAAQYICDLMEHNAALKELRIGHNDFGESAGVLLGTALASNDTIEKLDLSWNHLRGIGAEAIGKGLKANSGIKHFDISWNGFNHRGGLALAEAVAVNSTLLTLDVSNNRLSPLSVAAIITQLLVHNDSVVKIKLCLNPITPDVAKKIIKIVKEKMRDECPLEEIDLGDTVVDEEFIKLLSSLGEERNISISHGPVIKRSHDVVRVIERMYHDMDPVKAMFTYMQENGMRVVDLMHRLDLDKNNCVDRKEFVIGMKKMGFPLTRQQLDDLMTTMDRDSDGTVDLREFIAQRPRTLLGKKAQIDKQKVAELAASATI